MATVSSPLLDGAPARTPSPRAGAKAMAGQTPASPRAWQLSVIMVAVLVVGNYTTHLLYLHHLKGQDNGVGMQRLDAVMRELWQLAATTKEIRSLQQNVSAVSIQAQLTALVDQTKALAAVQSQPVRDFPSIAGLESSVARLMENAEEVKVRQRDLLEHSVATKAAVDDVSAKASSTIGGLSKVTSAVQLKTTSQVVGPNGRVMRRGKYRTPPYLCSYTEAEIEELSNRATPKTCRRDGSPIYFEGEWITVWDLRLKLVRPPMPGQERTVCVVACIDHAHPCIDDSCLFPLFLRRNTTDTLVADQMLVIGEMDLVANRYPYKTILDAGANCGISACIFSMMYPHATIVSIEPSTSNYEVLSKNAEMYGNIIPLKAGLWPRVASLSLAQGGRDLTYAEWGFMVYESDKVPAGRKVVDSLKGISINFIRDLLNIASFDLIKIDIEGSELEVFNAAPDNKCEWLDNGKVLVLELHEDMRPGAKKAVFDMMSSKSWKYPGTVGEYAVFEKVSELA